MVEALDIAAQVFAIVGALKQAYDAYRKVGKAVDEWGSSRQLDCLAVHLDALRQTGDVLTDAAAEGVTVGRRACRDNKHLHTYVVVYAGSLIPVIGRPEDPASRPEAPREGPAGVHLNPGVEAQSFESFGTYHRVP